MITLRLVRDRSIDDFTYGILFVGGQYTCHTLEPTILKIPAGTYGIKLYLSPKRNKIVPLLVNVPGRDMIEIHQGNFLSDTIGCILVGEGRNLNGLYSSIPAFSLLMAKLSSNSEMQIVVDDENQAH